MPDTSLAFKTATECLSLLAHGEVSSLELLEVYLARIERYDADLNCYCWLGAEQAREAAAAVKELPSQEKPLLGLPMSIKEAFNLVGAPTTWGVCEYRDNIATSDAVVVERLKAAGAIIYGKTNVSEYLDDIQSFNDVYGTTNNPWNRDRTPGGSSGGSAASLATGMTSLEVGSDIGGSIRTPSHFCGIFGHKPTWALIPSRGYALPGSCVEPDINVVGPMARSANDLDLLLDVLAHPDLLQSGLRYELPGLGDRRLADLKVAVWSNDDVAPVSGAVEAGVHKVAEALRANGATVDVTARPAFSSRHTQDVYYALLNAFVGTALPAEQYDALYHQAAAQDADDQSEPANDARQRTMSHQRWQQLHEQRERLRWHWHEFFQDFDALIAPQTATTAFAHDHRPMYERTHNVDGAVQPYWQQIFWAGLPGISHLPSTVIPTGPADDGLPVGVQVIGPAYADKVTVGVAALLEAEGFEFQPPPGYC